MREFEVVVTAVLFAGLLLWRRSASVGAMSDAPVSLENIRKGVARGWYKAQLCTIEGKPAVKLSGIANGKLYSDYYPVTQATWSALKSDGVPMLS